MRDRQNFEFSSLKTSHVVPLDVEKNDDDRVAELINIILDNGTLKVIDLRTSGLDLTAEHITALQDAIANHPNLLKVLCEAADSSCRRLNRTIKKNGLEDELQDGEEIQVSGTSSLGM